MYLVKDGAANSRLRQCHLYSFRNVLECHRCHCNEKVKVATDCRTQKFVLSVEVAAVNICQVRSSLELANKFLTSFVDVSMSTSVFEGNQDCQQYE